MNTESGDEGTRTNGRIYLDLTQPTAPAVCRVRTGDTPSPLFNSKKQENRCVVQAWSSELFFEAGTGLTFENRKR
jgi:hypothetical protein